MPAVVMRQSSGFNGVEFNNMHNNNMMMYPSDIVEQMLNSKIRSSCLNSNSNNFRPSNSSDRSRMEFGLC